MKKIILSVILCAMAFVAKAQVESVDFKTNFRGDFGVGVCISADLGNDFEFSPSANIYFWDCGTHFDFEADFHYNIDLGHKFTLYPIAGAVLCYANLKDHIDEPHHHLHHPVDDKDYYDGHLNFGINVGCGLKYDINPKIAGFVETKYQWINNDGDYCYDYNDGFLTLGIKVTI